MPSRRPGDTLTAEQLAPIRIQFFQECVDLLADLESGLLALEQGDEDPETVNTVLRAAHSIKGGAGIFGMDDLVRFSHEMETALTALRSGQIVADAAVLKCLLRAADILSDLVDDARDERKPNQTQVDVIIAELAALLPPADGEASPEHDGLDGFAFAPVAVEFEPVEFEPVEAWPAEERLWRVRFRPFADLYAKANDPRALLSELERLGPVDVQLDDSAIPFLPDLNVAESYLGWSVDLRMAGDEQAIQEVFEFVEGDCDLAITVTAEEEADGSDSPALAVPIEEAAQSPAPVQAAPSPPRSTATQAIRVDLERVDRLIDLVSELVISEATLAERVSESIGAGNSSVSQALDDLRNLTRDLQESVMAVRAQPVRSLFQRMSRLVRELEVQTGKSVRLVTDGDDTEVDRAVVERLTDPLTHMLRNAVDHGVEAPEKRLAQNKPAQGVVRIAASHRAGRVVIEVMDDGDGIDRERVRAIAIERGLIAASDLLSDEEIDNLIFEPGFSTTEHASDLSGRGVGMDVVRRSVQALGGRIVVSSDRGEGTRFTLSLPLTLAVMDGMLVTVRGQCLVIPLTALVETVMPRPGDVHRLGASSEVMAIRGAHVPLVDLGLAMDYGRQGAPSVDRSAFQGVALLVEDDGGERIALLVDDIIDQRQVVIKSLEANYRPLKGVAAATILGDGRVALIVDVNAIIGAQKARAAADAQLQVAYA